MLVGGWGLVGLVGFVAVDPEEVEPELEVDFGALFREPVLQPTIMPATRSMASAVLSVLVMMSSCSSLV